MKELIPWGISACMLLFAILTYVRTGRKDNKAEANDENAKFEGIRESLLKANMKLDQVCSTTNETRTDIKSLNKDIISLDRRVTVLESEIKTIKDKEN